MNYFDFDEWLLNHARNLPKLMGGGPNPGQIANFVVEKVEDLGTEYDLVRLTIRVPRYCSLNPDGSLYFTVGSQYSASIIENYPVPPEPTEEPKKE